MELNEPEVELFSAALDSMEEEIGHRLQSAVSEMEGHFPDNGYSTLMREAPSDIMKMFQEC